MTTILITGLTSDDKVPGFYPEIKYGVGRKSVGQLPVYVVLLGNIDEAAGQATLATVYDVFTDSDSKRLFGAGHELDRMCLAALRVPGVNIKAIGVAKNVTPTAASLTLTIGGSWTQAGQFTVRLGGKAFPVGVGAGDTTSNVATSTSNAIGSDERLFCTASPAAAIVTLTVKSASPRGNDWACYVDLTGAPSGLTVTLGGAGSALTGGGRSFGGGAGADDVTAALAALLSLEAPLHNYLGVAQNDATNAALVETQINTKAGPLVAQYELAVFGQNGNQAAGISLAQTTLNDAISEVVHMEASESHPAEIAATIAALRAFSEQSNPNTNYDAVVVPGIAPRAQSAMTYEPTHAQLKARLNAGVTPLVTANGKVVIVRAITTKCLTGSTPDYSTLDVGEGVVPMRMSREIGATWEMFKTSNPYAGPDPDVENGEKREASGVGTPKVWNAQVVPVLRTAERANWIEDVDGNLPTTIWDDEAERLMSAVNLKVRRLNHTLGVLIRQQA